MLLSAVILVPLFSPLSDLDLWVLGSAQLRPRATVICLAGDILWNPDSHLSSILRTTGNQLLHRNCLPSMTSTFSPAPSSHCPSPSQKNAILHVYTGKRHGPVIAAELSLFTKVLSIAEHA